MNLTLNTLAAFEPAHVLPGHGAVHAAHAAHAANADRAPGASVASLLCMLDEIDYGMALVTTTGKLRYANQLALSALTENGPLRLGGGTLFAPLADDQAQLRAALIDAARGLRRMLHLGDGPMAASIAVKPMASDEAVEDCVDEAASAPGLAMLVFGKRQACETLTVDIFSRTQKLTGAEASVLRALCSGQRPKQIACGAGVAVSTVRTQINSIRVKTQTGSIRELIGRVAALPPITPVMRSVVCH